MLQQSVLRMTRLSGPCSAHRAPMRKRQWTGPHAESPCGHQSHRRLAASSAAKPIFVVATRCLLCSYQSALALSLTSSERYGVRRAGSPTPKRGIERRVSWRSPLPHHDPGETEKRCHERDDKEDDCPVQHDSLASDRMMIPPARTFAHTRNVQSGIALLTYSLPRGPVAGRRAPSHNQASWNAPVKCGSKTAPFVCCCTRHTVFSPNRAKLMTLREGDKGSASLRARPKLQSIKPVRASVSSKKTGTSPILARVTR